MIGETIEQYRILELVGRGGMGSVYRALDINLERIVAIKMLNADLQNDPDFVERFRHEARVQASLNHPNVATLFGFFIHRNMPAAVMEFIEGDTLQARILRVGPIPAHISLPLFKQALQGVAAGHRRGIIHRDLKPANLMVNTEGVVKVTDFGIAKLQNSTGMTQMSTRIGSSFYMAPEQIVGQKVDSRTDIYAMGITLYEMLSGQTPFSAPSQYEIEHAHVNRVPPMPTTHYPHIPPAAVDAVMRALEKDPAKRFATAEEFIQALPDLQGKPYVGKSVEAPPPPAVVPAPPAVIASAPRPAAAVAATRLSPVPPPALEASPAIPDAAPVVPPVRTPVGRGGPKPLAIGAGVLAVIVAAGGATVLLRGRGSSPPPAAATVSTPAGSTNTDSMSADHADTFAAIVGSSGESKADASGSAAPPDLTTALGLTDKPPEPAAKPRVVASRPKGLPGQWTATYTDTANPQQAVVAQIQLEPGAGGAGPGDQKYGGVLRYATAAGAAAECAVNGSYSPERRHLQVLVNSCRGGRAPDWFNSPLEFDDVNPQSSALSGGYVMSWSGGHMSRLHNVAVTFNRRGP